MSTAFVIIAQIPITQKKKFNHIHTYINKQYLVIRLAPDNLGVVIPRQALGHRVLNDGYLLVTDTENGITHNRFRDHRRHDADQEK